VGLQIPPPLVLQLTARSGIVFSDFSTLIDGHSRLIAAAFVIVLTWAAVGTEVVDKENKGFLGEVNRKPVIHGVHIILLFSVIVSFLSLILH
jgi:hypothetical protein